MPMLLPRGVGKGRNAFTFPRRRRLSQRRLHLALAAEAAAQHHAALSHGHRTGSADVVSAAMLSERHRSARAGGTPIPSVRRPPSGEPPHGCCRFVAEGADRLSSAPAHGQQSGAACKPVQLLRGARRARLHTASVGAGAAAAAAQLTEGMRQGDCVCRQTQRVRAPSQLIAMCATPSDGAACSERSQRLTCTSALAVTAAAARGARAVQHKRQGSEQANRGCSGQARKDQQAECAWRARPRFSGGGRAQPLSLGRRPDERRSRHHSNYFHPNSIISNTN